MSEPTEKDVPSVPAQPPADPAKTPLDNLKGILAEADNVAQEKAKTGPSLPDPLPQSTASGPLETISKDIIRKVLLEVEALGDDKLSPRQIDSLLTPIIESNQLKAVQKHIEQREEGTESMKALRVMLEQSKNMPS